MDRQVRCGEDLFNERDYNIIIFCYHPNQAAPAIIHG